MSALGTWLLGRLQLPLAALGLAAILFGAGYATGVKNERRVGVANSLQQRIDTLEADMRLAGEAQRSAAAKAEELEAQSRQHQEERDALRQLLADRPEGGGHPATDGDLDLIYGRAE